MNAIQRLLVIVNPDFKDDHVLARARRLTRAFRPEVHLLVDRDGLASAQEYFTDIDVTVQPHVTEKPLDHDDILDLIRETGPDLVMKSIRRRHRLARLLVTGTDWKLIRHTPCPLWLVKNRDWHDDGTVLAAVDPLHSKAQQNELDHLLLDTTTALAEPLALQPAVYHCYFPDVSTMFPKVLDAGDYLKKQREKHRSKMEELLQNHGIGMDRVAMVRGDLVRTLNNTIRNRHSNLLVLGALSRNVVERAIIGSTTEKMIHQSRCDVLVMKSLRQRRTS